MKAKIKIRDARRLHAYCFGYCEIQNLLHMESPVFYTSNAYGWRADFYKMEDPRNGNTVRVSTGYGPTGDRYIPYDTYKKREDKSHKIKFKTMQELKTKLRILFFKMIKEHETTSN